MKIELSQLNDKQMELITEWVHHRIASRECFVDFWQSKHEGKMHLHFKTQSEQNEFFKMMSNKL